jgi:hypothetical protein
MNEANTPFNEPVPESADVVGSVWEDAYRELLEGENVAEHLPNSSENDAETLEQMNASSPAEVPPVSEDWQDWQTLDFPNAISADAIERQFYSEPNADAQPNVTDLISLIQELNQCNNILLDRVSLLEDALERSQTALRAEVERSQAQQAIAPQAVQELMTAQEQIVQLSNQLEFAQQTHQRQQIRIETLAAQLDSSQERVAQLEREAALAQQRFEQQSHMVAQTENVCRDLQARLQRQQRYTLQFKAALEKCLDVPPPSYESQSEPEQSAVSTQTWQEAQTALAGSVFLPKSQRIQPWSFRDLLVSEPVEDADRPTRGTDDFNNKLRLTLASEQMSLSADETDDLEVAQSQLIGSSTDLQEEAIAVPPVAEPLKSPSYEVRSTEPQAPIESLSDLAPASEDPVEAIDLQSVLNSLAAGNLSSSEIAAAEETLWQDLAKLIDASAEDIAKVSASENFTDFATQEEDAVKTEELATKSQTPDANIESVPAPETVHAAVDAPQPAQPKSSAIHLPAMLASTLQSVRQTAAQQSSEAQNRADSPALPGVLTASSTWPSPIVYPLRPPKKRASLAAVDLPSFPRVGS